MPCKESLGGQACLERCKKTKQPHLCSALEPKPGTTKLPSHYVHSTVVCRKVAGERQSNPELQHEKTEGLPEAPWESLGERMVLWRGVGVIRRGRRRNPPCPAAGHGGGESSR
ncbi:hypothetical protein QYF61_016827, partial [Mycteria americana]